MVHVTSSVPALRKPQGITVRKVSRNRIHTTLQQRFGLKRLREGQEDVIDRVLAGRHTLAIMPTGAGKSLCYQLPALLLKGRTVVVSPLIALMKDQCESLTQRGIAAVEVNSALDVDSRHKAERAIADGSARIVLTTPERLADPDFMALLQQQPTSLLVVDEAHCISQWGHDFRPAFLEIAPALRLLGKPAVLALTATATQAVTADITAQLGIPAKAGVVNTGAFRANLHYRVEPLTHEDEKLVRTLAIARNTAGSGVIYTATVKAAEAVYQALRAADEPARLYHGKLPAAERHAAQEAFMAGESRLMVATNAFGLGIDKADIRFVVHYQMPAGLDAYYQESGRAGRDGETASCTLLFLRSDKAVQQFFMSGRYPGADDVEALYRALENDCPGASSLDGWPLDALQRQLQLPLNKLKVATSLLRRQRVAAINTKGNVYLLKKRLDTEGLRRLMTVYGGKREHDRAALESMVTYAQSGQCRWQLLLDHLQEDQNGGDAVHCGTCDNCRHIATLEAELADRARETIKTLGADAATPPSAAAGLPAATPLAMTFKPEDLVQVKRYGQGRVVTTDALSVTVEFEAGTQRSFQADFVQKVGTQQVAGDDALAMTAVPAQPG